MPRYKISVEYKGTNYVGWQNQDNGISIQSLIEEALNSLTLEKSKVFGAGRTDAGVHAIKQIAHFDIKKNFSEKSIKDGLNQHLRPNLISITEANKVPNTFHARFSAKQRYYKYVIINRRAPLTLENELAWIVYKKLNIKNMQEASKYFLGKHNFEAFRSINCQSKSPIKTIDYIEVKEEKNKIIIEVKAKSFLHSQVRIIAGTLVEVGKGKIKPNEIKDIITEGKRKESGPTAPALGLYLVSVSY